MTTVEHLARCLYALHFPRREFDKLPESVQECYRMDAARLQRMIETEGARQNPHARGFNDAADDAPSGGEAGR